MPDLPLPQEDRARGLFSQPSPHVFIEGDLAKVSRVQGPLVVANAQIAATLDPKPVDVPQGEPQRNAVGRGFLKEGGVDEFL